MNFDKAADQRLVELQRAGVRIPWAAAGMEGVTARLSAPASRPEPGEPAQAFAPAEPPEVVAPAEPSARTVVEPPVRTVVEPSVRTVVEPSVRTVVEPSVRTGAEPSGLPAPAVDIDLQRLERLGYLAPDLAHSMAAEEFRQIKRAVLDNVVRDGADDRSALIMISSAIPAEGKTFCAINLAMSIAAEVDTSVLLVDADVLRPSIFPRLGLPSPRLGLLDLLVNENLALSDVLVRTNVPKLSLLPTGTFNASASELLASGAMQRLLHELLARYPDRVVLFDTPPLLVASSAATLATRMGQIVMVVESEATSRRQIAQAFAAVERCPNVMSVLNRCSAAPERHAYGDYYGYGGDRDTPTGLPNRKRWFGGRKSAGD